MSGFRSAVAALIAAVIVHGSAWAATGKFATPGPGRALPSAGGEAVAASNNTAYVSSASQDHVAVIDQGLGVTIVPVGHTPRFIALSSGGFITSNAGDNTVSVQTTFSAAVSVPVGGSGPIAGAPFSNIAYLLRSDGVIVRVDTATVTTSSFDSGLRAPV